MIRSRNDVTERAHARALLYPLKQIPAYVRTETEALHNTVAAQNLNLLTLNQPASGQYKTRIRAVRCQKETLQ